MILHKSKYNDIHCTYKYNKISFCRGINKIIAYYKNSDSLNLDRIPVITIQLISLCCPVNTDMRNLCPVIVLLLLLP